VDHHTGGINFYYVTSIESNKLIAKYLLPFNMLKRSPAMAHKESWLPMVHRNNTSFTYGGRAVP
jgi:hypothetical protein